LGDGEVAGFDFLFLDKAGEDVHEGGEASFAEEINEPVLGQSLEFPVGEGFGDFLIFVFVNLFHVEHFLELIKAKQAVLELDFANLTLPSSDLLKVFRDVFSFLRHHIVVFLLLPIWLLLIILFLVVRLRLTLFFLPLFDFFFGLFFGLLFALLWLAVLFFLFDDFFVDVDYFGCWFCEVDVDLSSRA